MYASEKDLICYYKNETKKTISSAKCPFLNRDCVEHNADYLGEYADNQKGKMR